MFATEPHELTNSGIIACNVDMRYAMTRVYLSEVKQVFGPFIMPVIVRTDAMIPRSQSNRRTIFEQERAEGEKSRAAGDFKLARPAANDEVFACTTSISGRRRTDTRS